MVGAREFPHGEEQNPFRPGVAFWNVPTPQKPKNLQNQAASLAG